MQISAGNNNNTLLIMKRILSIMALAALALSINSCGFFVLSETPPASVTKASNIALYKKAVAGDPGALWTIGSYYNLGLEGFPKNIAKADLCYRKASNAGSGIASMTMCQRSFQRGSYSLAIHYGELALRQGGVNKEQVDSLIARSRAMLHSPYGY